MPYELRLSLNDLTLLLIACEYFVCQDNHGERDPAIARDNNIEVARIIKHIRRVAGPDL